MPSKVTKKEIKDMVRALPAARIEPYSLIDNLVFDAIKNEVFPGAGLCVIKNGRVVLDKVYGYSEKIPPHKKMTQKTVFDIASLTKPIATATLCMLAYQEGKIDLDHITFPSDLAGVTVRHLLNHTSGLPDYREYYKIVPSPLIPLPQGEREKMIVKKILSEKLLSKPGEKVLYSDLGYILLGVILEKIYDASLDKLFEEKIATPLHLSSTGFHPLPVSLPPRGGGKNTKRKKDREFAATEFCQFRKRMIIGEVMDENCFVMGGVAGHAGLFSTSGDISKWLLELRKAKEGKSRLIDQKTFRVFCLDPLKEQESRRTGELGRHRPDRFFTLGFETPSHPSSSGKYFSSNSLGHLGYTGTSFWWDVEKDWMVILLTNRVHPTRENKKIQEFRPKLHDVIVESMFFEDFHPLPVSLPPASCAKVALATAAEQGGGTKKKKEMTRSKNKVEIRCGFPDDF